MAFAYSTVRWNPTLRQICYASGNFGKNVVWTTFDTLVLFYFVTVVGLPVFIAGAVIVTATLVDALLDIAIAAHADRTGATARLGQYLLFAGALCGFAFAGTFMLPALAGRPAPALALACYILARLGYMVGDVAHNTLLVGIALTTGDAARVSGYRLLFSAAGAAAVGYSVSAIYAVPIADRNHMLGLAGIAGGFVYALTMGIAFLATRRQAYGASSHAGTQQVQKIERQPWQSLIPVFGLIVVQSALVPSFTRALPFYATEVYRDPAWAGHALRVLALSQACSLLAWITAAERVTPKAMLLASHGLNILGVILILIVPNRLADLPLAMLGLSYAGMNMAIWAMIPQAVRGTRGVSLAVSLFVSAFKSGAALGTIMLTTSVWLFDATPLAGLSSIVLFATLGPGVGSAVCIMAVLSLSWKST